MKDITIQSVFDTILDYLPANMKWNKIAFYAGYLTDDSKIFAMSCFLKQNSHDEYKDFCDIPECGGISMFFKMKLDIHKLLVEERNDLPNDSKWTELTLVVDNTGDFKMNLDYQKIDNQFESLQNWMKINLS